MRFAPLLFTLAICCGQQSNPNQSKAPVQYKYVTGTVLSLLPGPSGQQLNDPNQVESVAWGDRLKYLGESGDYFYLESYAGRKGYIAKRFLDDADPKVYFEGTIGGQKHFGFLYGLAHISFLDTLFIKTGAGEVRMPIKQVQRIEISAKGMRVIDEDGGVTEAEDINGRFVYGPKQSISSGKGAELWLRRSDVKQTLVLTRVQQ